MKTIFKIILINILCNSIYAKESSLYTRFNYPYQSIHKILVKKTSPCCYVANIFTSVGHLVGGNCKYEMDTRIQEINLCDSEENIFLIGPFLKEKVGSGFTCAATHIKTVLSEDLMFSEYELIEDQENYIKTKPENSILLLNSVCN